MDSIVRNGFTLVELLVVVAIAAILLTLGTPSFRNLVQDNRLVTATNLLVSEFSLARSEAAKRGRRLIICKSNTSSASAPTCNTPAAWNDGWLVFVDGDGNTTFDAANDTLIRVNQGISGGVAITSTAADNIRFQSDGRAETGKTDFRLCDARGPGHGRLLRVSSLGRSSVVRASPGNDLTGC